MFDGRPVTDGPPPPRVGLGPYLAAVAVTVAAILSQYVVPQHVPATRPVYGSLVGDLLVVYGVPILAFAVLVGAAPLARAVGSMGKASVEGLRWYGVMGLAALLLTLALAVLYLIVDPSAIGRLSAPNPDIEAAKGDPWFWVGFSFVIGIVEETIFRGWIYGYWIARGSPRWLAHAIWTSALFAVVHLYYATTYGPAVGLFVPTLFLAGLGFAFAYRWSGGNLLVIGLLHGLFDSSAFLYLISPTAGDLLRYLPIVAGLAVAASLRRPSAPSPPRPGASLL